MYLFHHLPNLTLTSVVFELRFWLLKATNAFYLTLTSVVFELDIKEKISKPDRNLTLTSVVFESANNPYSLFPSVFNFNKCCI